MNVLSLFDGISCGQLALQRVGIKIDKYYASEIKHIAIKVTQANFPNTIQLGDVRKIDLDKLKDIDLLIGGSPCQNLSIAQANRQGLRGDKSKLFWEYVRVLKYIQPKYFLLENVARAKKEDIDYISLVLGVKPIKINSSLVSAQLRDRMYWTNIPGVTLPEDKRIKLQDILTSGYTDREKARCLLVSDSRPLRDRKRMLHRYNDVGFTTLVFENLEDKENTCRYLNQTELERLQTLPEGYTSCLNRNQAANVIGDAWSVDVIAHIFAGLRLKDGIND